LKSFDGLRFRVPGVLSNRLESISFSRIFTSTSHLFPKYRVNSPQSVPCEVSAWNPRSITFGYVVHHIMQSVFSVAARRRNALEGIDAGCRAGALKTDWTKPVGLAGQLLIYIYSMGIESK
jgi:hypothetical protein